MLSTPTETENVCTTCKHFTELEGVFFCRFFDAFLSPQTFCIPCDFQEKIENPVVSPKDGDFGFTLIFE
jgi:hypothetical protein